MWPKERFMSAKLSILVLVSSLLATSVSSVRSEGIAIYSPKLLEQTIQQWAHRDGDLGRELSDYWCDFAVQDPGAFLTVFSHHEAVFDQWLEELPDLSFTQIGGCVDRECLRTMLIKSIDFADFSKRQSVLGSRLSARLKKIHVEKVG